MRLYETLQSIVEKYKQCSSFGELFELLMLIPVT